MTDQPTPEIDETLSALDAQQKIVREHTLSLHVMGEQLTQIESWFWAHLADIRDAARQQIGGPLPDDVTAAEPDPSDPTQCSGDEGFCPEHGFHRHSLKQPGPEQATCLHPDGYDGECPCPPSCACCQVAARTTPDNPATSSDTADNPLRDQIAEALMQWAEHNNNPKFAPMRRPETVTRNAYGRADAILAVVDRDRRVLADEVTRLSAITGQLRALATRWQATVRPGERHPAAAAILNVLDGDGPSVAEATADDRVWPLQKGGE
jgi:hypothetical protein